MQRSFQLGSSGTPKPLKYLILITVCVSTAVALLFQFFGWSFLFFLLSLNTAGIKSFYLWQVFTYLFVQPIQNGVSFAFLVHIFFNMYLLWIAGSVIYKRKGRFDFFAIYFGSGMIAGFVAALCIFLGFSGNILSGSFTAVYALLTIWMMFEPNLEFQLFFTVPIKSKWLILGILGINFFLDFSQGDFLSLFADLAAIIAGYLIALLAYETHSPFTPLKKFEFFVMQTKASILNRFHGHHPQSGKIHHFPLSKKQKRDKFIDDCLEKISRRGKSSLSIWEQLKLWWFSRHHR